MIHIIRASHTNEFELQNYKGIDATVISSHNPLTQTSLPVIKFWSLTDLPNFPFRRQIFNRLFGGEQWLFGLKSYLSNHYHDSNHSSIVHTAETYTPYTHQVVQLRKSGEITKLICTCWETIPHNNEKFARLRKWKQDAHRYIDIFHTPTELAKQALISEGVDAKKIRVIPYGVDVARFDQPVKKIKNKRPRILTVARLEIEKGMSIIEQVASSLPEYDFLIVGTGAYNPRGNNIMVEQVEYSKIHSIYKSADLFFLPSQPTPTWEEQYGMALIEAMATGLPIVTTSCGAIEEVLGEAGIIVGHKNVDKMVKTIKSIISYPEEKARYYRLSQKRASDLYDAKKAKIKLLALYK